MGVSALVDILPGFIRYWQHLLWRFGCIGLKLSSVVFTIGIIFRVIFGGGNFGGV